MGRSYPNRIGHIYANETTIPVTVLHRGKQIIVVIRTEGTLGRRFCYLSGCFGRPGLIERLLNKREVTLKL